ncbi:glycosyltransferase family 9 protein [Candidatus Synechococcus calcipolaris G9]|uniref:Glycosyltransferase family 9 protein n=1 Tax=Candidatus Synechococcus calcipolaris G9 TaxID=1497997 RepID=A0ABT6F3D9_9SYNE|nr:glycosyltransferase family 9 protein [Candidatus Synechococcus calcipolaris]MDG2992287.1 glycosyltransferase family 9 protein [Candidatus Synechococcus calcipolaris G9]
MKNVIAFVPGGIGDQILFFPTLDDLKHHYPEIHLDVVAEPRAIAAYRLNAAVDKVIPFDFKNRNALADWSNLIGTIREGEYEAILSLGKSLPVRLLLWLTGIPQRVGFGSSSFGLLTHPVSLNKDQYSGAMYHDLLKGFGITTPAPLPTITIADADHAWAQAEQERLGLGRDYLLIHGGSSQLAIAKGINKIYPVPAWAEVIKQLKTRNAERAIAVVQGPEDQEWVSHLKQIVPSISVVSPPDLGKLAAFIAAAGWMLCTDSGPMHIGVAARTRLVALFGPTDPAKLLPADARFIAIKSATGQMADISAVEIVDAIHG